MNAAQAELPLRMTRPQQVDLEVVRRQATLTGAIKLCIAMSGFDSDKQVYMQLGIDPGHWSRIMKGDAHFPQDKLIDLIALCGNEAPAIWLADRLGYSLQPLESELEKRARVAEQRADELEQKLEHFAEFMRTAK